MRKPSGGIAAAARKAWPPIRKGLVFVGGALVLLAGIVMLFTPGQGILTVLLGLAILATEFHWARRLYVWVKRKGRSLARRAKQRLTEVKQTIPKGSIGFYVILALYIAYGLLFIYSSSAILDGERHFFLFDDAMVSMRYARNLAQGYGLVWNPGGERVEGFTNLLWVLYMALVHLLPIPASKICLFVQLSGLACLTGTLFAVRALARDLGGGSPATELSAVAMTAFYLPLNNWSLQGMEVGLLALTVAVSVLLFVRGIKSQTAPPLPYILLGASTLARLDMAVPLLAAALFMAYVDAGRRARHILWAALSAGVFLGGQTAFRLAYYGDPLPNTCYLKMTGYPAFDRMLRGAHEYMHFVRGMNWALVCLPLAVVPFRRYKAACLLLWVFLCQSLYSIYVGGDAWEWYGGSNRFVCIVMPLFFILFALALGRILFETPLERKVRDEASIRGLGACAVVVACMMNFNAIRGPEAWREWVLLRPPLYAKENAQQARLAYRIRALVTREARVAVVWAGGIPYWSDLQCVDLLGKNDRRIAHLRARYSTARFAYEDFLPGHMKWDYSYSIGILKPDVILGLWGRPEEALPYLAKDYEQSRISAEFTELANERPYFRRGSKNVRWDELRKIKGIPAPIEG